MLLGRLRNHPRRRFSANAALGERTRVEERCHSLAKASQEWRSLLQEMEHLGQSGEPQYDAYFRAYLKVKEQHRRVDLELFNLRQNLRAR